MSVDPQPVPNDTPRRGKWVLAALAAAQGATGAVAAAAGEVSLPTLRRWQRLPRFREKVEELRTQLLSESVGKLVSLHTAAIATLGDLLSDANSSVRLSAASKILSLTLACREQVQLSEAAEEIKALLAEQKRGEAGAGYSRSSN